MPPSPTLPRRCLAEALGACLLVAGVVGSGIAAARRSPGDPGLQLLENALATGGVLAALIVALGPVSGAHLNPLVSLVEALRGRLSAREAGAYAGAQTLGAVAGTLLAHGMHGWAWIGLGGAVRSGGGLWLAEAVATAGLLLTIHGTLAGRREALPWAVAAYVGGAYWFTSSTAFANPAVTLARGLTDSFAGIAPASVPGFVLAQVAGAAAGAALLALLLPGWWRRAQPAQEGA